MSVEDAQNTRMIQREITKRHLDSTQLDVHVSHGVAYLRGMLKAMRGHDCDLEHEVGVICHIIRSLPGIRSVVNEVSLR